MCSENEDQLSPKSPAGSEQAFRKQSKISYTRDFLLSFSELDVCKNLPCGFDASVLSELEDASNNAFERQRSLGGSSLQNPKRNDYGSLPLNRLEGSSSYSRGSTGRWDTRSSGSSDRDGDLQSDRESSTQDSGWCSVNPTRRFWKNPDHDGLLGSGAFPRPPGYAGSSAPKARGNGDYQLNRSSEPYQPPRPYKAGPYSRKDCTDSFNDETFGSVEFSNQDRADEERKRRASFELMRKEQHKALQEKQKQVPNDHKEKNDTDIMVLLANSEAERTIRSRGNKSDDSVAPSHSQNDSARPSSHIQAPVARPSVPPGFSSALMEKNISVQSSSTSLTIENDDFKNTYADSVGTSESNVITSSGVEVVKHSVGFEDVSCEALSLQNANEVWEDTANDLSNKEEAREVMNAVGDNHSTSILEKLFGTALSKNCSSSSNFVENQGVKVDEEAWAPISESSKFAHFFLEEKKPLEDMSSRDLLSLITNNEKAGSQASIVKSDKGIERTPPSLFSGNNDPFVELLAASATPSLIATSEQYYPSEKLHSSPGVITCEDLEKFIMAEVIESSSTLQQGIQGPRSDGKPEDQKAGVVDSASQVLSLMDNPASQHLLYLLHKGTNLNESISSPRIEVKGSSEASLDLGITDNSGGNSEAVRSSEKTLTLEALFGAAFMNELHSVEAPLSVKGGSAGEIINTDVTESHGLPLPRGDDGFFSSTPNEYRANRSIPEGNLTAPNHTQQGIDQNTQGSWLMFGASPVESSKLGDLGFEEGSTEILLPEEDSLITVGDSLDPINSETPPSENSLEELEKTAEELNDNILRGIVRSAKNTRRERLNTHILDGPRLLHGPYNTVNSDHPYNRLHGTPASHIHHQINQASPQIHHQMNQTEPLFHQLDHHTYGSPQMKFIGPASLSHDPRHSFPMNVIPQHAFNVTGGPRFDPAAHQPMLEHMPIPVNFPPHHPIQDFPRGSVPLPHPMNHMPGYIPEMNNVHNFPLHHRQPNFGGFGMGMPGVGGGAGAHPEALERLIEMEMRANSKQHHHSAGGHIPGIYGPQNDMNFRYR